MTMILFKNLITIPWQTKWELSTRQWKYSIAVPHLPESSYHFWIIYSWFVLTTTIMNVQRSMPSIWSTIISIILESIIVGSTSSHLNWWTCYAKYCVMMRSLFYSFHKQHYGSPWVTGVITAICSTRLQVSHFLDAKYVLCVAWGFLSNFVCSWALYASIHKFTPSSHTLHSLADISDV